MAQVLMTIEEYIVEVRKKDTIFIGFSSKYAKVMLRLPVDDLSYLEWLDEKYVKWEKREGFKQFMAENMPNIRLTEVYDIVPQGYITWPYLGTIAIDVEINSPEHKAIDARYEDEDGMPKSLDEVVYIMRYKKALEGYEKRKALEDEEDE